MGGIYVALLRGINVGGHNRVAMKELLPMFEGCEPVQSYIQSGNVVFGATPRAAANIPAVITAAIRERLGLEIPVMVRDLDEMRATVEKNPFEGRGVPEAELHVAFLAAAPSHARIDALDARRSPPDEFQVIGKELYLRLPNGAGRTKLTSAYFDGKLGTLSTQRNWRTVKTLLAMMEAAAGSR